MDDFMDDEEGASSMATEKGSLAWQDTKTNQRGSGRLEYRRYGKF